DRYALILQTNQPDAILPEHIISATGVARILEEIFQKPGMTTRDFDKLYTGQTHLHEFGTDAATRDLAIERLKAVGRYLGEVLAALHKGDFTHMDTRANWP